MNLVELDQALRKLRLSGMADVLETRLLQAQAEQMGPDRPRRRARHRRAPAAPGPPARPTTQAGPLPRPRTLARRLRLRLQQEDQPRPRLRARHRPLRRPARGRSAIGPARHGQEHLAQAIGRAAIQQGYRVIYREAHAFLEELAEATLAETRKDYLTELTRVPLLIIDDLGMRKLPHTAAEDLLELIMRRYERASTVLTSNRPVEDWGKLLGDTAAVTALLDRLLHHAHVLKCGPRSWRTRVQTTLPTQGAVR